MGWRADWLNGEGRCCRLSADRAGSARQHSHCSSVRSANAGCVAKGGSVAAELGAVAVNSLRRGTSPEPLSTRHPQSSTSRLPCHQQRPNDRSHPNMFVVLATAGSVAVCRPSACCCPLAPPHRSASGLAINICDVLVEEGGPRIEAKRRGGDPLPRCQAQSQISGASGQPGYSLGYSLYKRIVQRAPQRGPRAWTQRERGGLWLGASPGLLAFTRPSCAPTPRRSPPRA